MVTPVRSETRTVSVGVQILQDPYDAMKHALGIWHLPYVLLRKGACLPVM